MQNGKELFVRVERVVRLAEVLEPLSIQMANQVMRRYLSNGLKAEELRITLLNTLLEFDWEKSGIRTLSAITTTEKGS